MTLRHWFIVYLAVLHCVFAIPSYFILNENRLFLFAVEGFYLVSLVTGIVLVQFLFKPFELISTGAELIEEEDFISTLRPTGQRELDRLISLFNTMLVKLRNERLQAEEQHYFLEKLIGAIPLGIILLDYDDCIDTVNPGACRLLGCDGKLIAGQPVSRIGEPFRSVLGNLADDTSQVVPYRGNRRLRIYKSHFVDRGFPRSFILIEELTEEIRQSEKTAYGKLIRMMSHEVNNSVGAVGSLLQSCRNYTGQIGADDRDDFTMALDVSINRLRNLNTFMKQYADIIRLPNPSCAVTDAVALMKRCAKLFHEESAERGIRWKWFISHEFPAIRCDQAQMEQVFVNIFKNAMEAIGADGEIEITCTVTGPTASICISDTGCGISPEVQNQLFSPFFSTKDNGQGIGLTVVREILERHGFQFALERGAANRTEFRIDVSTDQNSL